MPHSLRPTAELCQGLNDSLNSEDRGNELSPVLSDLRSAIDNSGWKHEALAVRLQLPNAAYLSRMLSGEKPWTLRHLTALPDEIEALFLKRWTERHGLVVVAPATSVKAAVESLTSGLFGLLAPAAQLPEKAGAPLKASLDSKLRKRA